MEKILLFKCYHQNIRMEEEGISNIYIDGLTEKISYPFRGTFSIDKIPTSKVEHFSIVVILSQKMRKERILLERHLQKIQLYTLIHMELNTLI